MGDVADDMMAEAERWAFESRVCNYGHRYLEDGFGCSTCEMLAEDGKCVSCESPIMREPGGSFTCPNGYGCKTLTLNGSD